MSKKHAKPGILSRLVHPGPAWRESRNEWPAGSAEARRKVALADWEERQRVAAANGGHAFATPPNAPEPPRATHKPPPPPQR